MSSTPEAATTHLWVRAEQRDNEERVGLTPAGAKALIDAGIRVTVEHSSVRAIPIDGYIDAGVELAPENSWPTAPADAIIFGLKELPEDGTALNHRHIMFGHAYKGQPAGRVLLDRFAEGGGTLYDLEYLTHENGRRVAAFGYWAGFAGAAVAYHCWVAQQQGGEPADAIRRFANREALVAAAAGSWTGERPKAVIIGALGRVGTGAGDFCDALGIAVTRWDIAETASGGPFPEILEHEIFLNCILAQPGCPVFVPASAAGGPRKLTTIGDIACDPTSDFSPIKVYDRVTTWERPALRVHSNPPLDVVAIDNLPSLLPIESSEDYAAQLLPSLLTLTELNTPESAGVWQRAETIFQQHLKHESEPS
jgi:saccharopine dehydrogenase (NAD+, L-lysine forming)